jgi:small-conductance mechanosensitive channel
MEVLIALAGLTAEATAGTWLDPRRWIPVGIVLVMFPLVPVCLGLLRVVWSRGLRRMPGDLRRGTRRVDTVVAFIRSIAYFALTIMLVFFTLNAVFPSFNPLAATGALSIVALILTGMFKDIVVDVVKGLDILLGAHYDIGDFIEVADASGHVVDFQLKYTKLRTASGEQVVLNNAKCIPSKCFRSGYVVNYVDIPLADAGDESAARDVVERAGAELNQLVEAVRDTPSYCRTFPLPATGGVLIRYQISVLPGARWVLDDGYLPLLNRSLEAANIPLAGGITSFHMNDVETFRKLFDRTLTEAEIRKWADRE